MSRDILLTQIKRLLPEEAESFRLISTSGGSVFPRNSDEVFTARPIMISPAGIPDGEYYVEFYTHDGIPITDYKNAPAVVELYRREPPPVTTAPAVVTAATPAIAVTASKPESEEISANPEKWANIVQIRQDAALRELVVSQFEDGLGQLAKLREQWTSIGETQLASQKKVLEHGLEVLKMQQSLGAQQKADLDQRLKEYEQAAKAASSQKPRADYTQLGLGLISGLEAIAVPLITGLTGHSKKKKKKKKDSEESEANEAIEELLKFSNPADLQKLLTDPEEQERFATRLKGIAAKTKAGKNVQSPKGKDGTKQLANPKAAATPEPDEAASASESAAKDSARTQPTAEEPEFTE